MHQKNGTAKTCGAVWWIACYSFSGAHGGGARSDPLCEHLFGKLICTSFYFGVQRKVILHFSLRGKVVRGVARG